MYGIKCNVMNTDCKIDEGVSKFFGNPYVPKKWQDDNVFSKTELFFCQINLADIEKIDDDGYLPHEGYLYFFFDVSKYPYKPVVRYYAQKPDVALKGFNKDIDIENDPTKPFAISFAKSLENNIYYSDEFVEEGTKLLGTCEELYEMQVEENDVVLLSYDCNAHKEIGFFANADAKLVLTIDKTKLKANDFSDVRLYIIRN